MLRFIQVCFTLPCLPLLLPTPSLPHCSAPCREDFFDKVGARPDDEAAMEDMHAFCSGFGALLGEVHAFLAENGLDDPTKV